MIYQLKCQVVIGSRQVWFLSPDCFTYSNYQYLQIYVVHDDWNPFGSWSQSGEIVMIDLRPNDNLICQGRQVCN